MQRRSAQRFVFASQRWLLQRLFAAVVGFAARRRGASAAGGHQTVRTLNEIDSLDRNIQGTLP
jgi:hypothetical protein